MRFAKNQHQMAAGLLFFLGLLAAAAILVAAFLFLGTSTTMVVTIAPVAPSTNGVSVLPGGGIRNTAQADSSLAGAKATLAGLKQDSPALEFYRIAASGSERMKERRRAVNSLGELGSDEAFAALRVLLYESSELKPWLAEAFGLSGHPEGRGLLLQLIDDADENVIMGAIRGFGFRGDAEAASILGNILGASSRSEEVRIEAAVALGDIPDASATAALTVAAADIQNPDIAEKAIDGLGHRPFAETREFFQDYLGNRNVPGDLKVSALEALGNAQGDASSLLLKYARSEDPELRAAAAYGLMTVETERNIASDLLQLIGQENEAGVRARLLQALSTQDAFDLAAVVSLARKESNTEARLLAFDVISTALERTPDTEALEFFTNEGIPFLLKNALEANSENGGIGPVLSLNRSGTAESRAALETIARQAKTPKIREAAQAALR